MYTPNSAHVTTGQMLFMLEMRSIKDTCIESVKDKAGEDCRHQPGLFWFFVFKWQGINRVRAGPVVGYGHTACAGDRTTAC